RPRARIELRRHLDLDDVGAPVGELAHAGRPRPDAGQVEHSEPAKGLRGPGGRHFGELPGGRFRAVGIPECREKGQRIKRLGRTYSGGAKRHRASTVLVHYLPQQWGKIAPLAAEMLS